MNKFFNILGVIVVAIFSLTAIFFSTYVLYKIGNSKDGNLSKELSPVFIDQTECSPDEYLENEICVSKNKTCPDGSVIPVIDYCKTIDNSTSTNEISTTTEVSSTTTSSIPPKIISKPKEILPIINNITITNGVKSMIVSISGKNFDSSSNIITLIAGTEISKKMTLPAFPMPDKTQQINFKITDFRDTYNGVYSFQVESKGKLSNVYNLYK